MSRSTTEARALAAAPAAKTGRDPDVLVNRVEQGDTIPHAAARLAVEGLLGNAQAIRQWSEFIVGKVDVTETVLVLDEDASRVKRNDLGAAEALLMAQAQTLNAVFINLTSRAHTTRLLEQFETNMRLALKAQSQCRATLETLATVKNPPTVFARQANIANGPQQVNNGAAVSVVPTSRAAIPEPSPNRLLEAHGEERMDAPAALTTGDSDPALVPVGTLDRPADAGRKSPVCAERVSRRRAASVSRPSAPTQRDASDTARDVGGRSRIRG